MLNVIESDAVVVNILAERPEERCDGVGGGDKHGRENLPVIKSHNLGGAATHIYSYY